MKELIAAGDGNSEVSNIVYLDILDENADSDETMLQVAENLLEDMESIDHDGYVVVVGDGKTYDHLLNLKRLVLYMGSH